MLQRVHFGTDFGRHRQRVGAVVAVMSIIVASLAPVNAFAKTLPNDPRFTETQGFANIALTEAWDYTQGSHEVVVAVLDTGVDTVHPDLADNIWHNSHEVPDNGVDDDGDGHIDDIVGWDFVDNDNNPRPDVRREHTEIGLHHGTIVAGVIGAVGNNGEDGAGVAWRVRIMPLRILDSLGSGDSSNAEKAIDYAIEHKADIINLSFVGSTPSLTFIQAIRRAYRAGIVIVAAAGATGDSAIGMNLEFTPQYPVCFDDPLKEENWILGVAAVNTEDTVTQFSNYGGGCIDITAPGSRMASTMVFEPNHGFVDSFGGAWSGTSISAPQVAGTAALLKSINPNWTNTQIYKAIIDTADPIEEKNPGYRGNIGHGRLNIRAATAAAWSERATRLGSLVVASSLRARSIEFFQGATSTAVRTVPIAAMNIGSIAVGDTDGDGVSEIIVGSSAGVTSEVFIFDEKGGRKGRFSVFPRTYRGGVSVAAGDLNGDGRAEIIVAPLAAGVGSQVKIFYSDGRDYGGFSVGNGAGAPTTVAVEIKAGRVNKIITATVAHETISLRVWTPDGGFIREWKKAAVGGRGFAPLSVHAYGLSVIALGTPPGAVGSVDLFTEDGESIASVQPFGRQFKGGIQATLGEWTDPGGVHVFVAPVQRGSVKSVKILSTSGIEMGSFVPRAIMIPVVLGFAS